MGKYSDLYAHVYSVFGTQEWVNEAIVTFPESFNGNKTANEYITVTMIPSSHELANQTRSVSGQILIDIFTPAGEGPRRSYEIADLLDKHFSGKTKSNGSGSTQFMASVLSGQGEDPDNPSLYRILYSIPFTYYGV